MCGQGRQWAGLHRAAGDLLAATEPSRRDSAKPDPNYLKIVSKTERQAVRFPPLNLAKTECYPIKEPSESTGLGCLVIDLFILLTYLRILV